MGVDFSYVPDNKIYAPEDGNYRLYPNNGTLGNAIHMWTGNRHHAFGHTSKYLITDNQFVKRGTPIAIMGATGAADGVHLHWALAINGSLVDPLTQVNESFIGGNAVIVQDAPNWYGRLNKLHWQVRGREMGRASFLNFVGKDTLTVMEAFSDDKEADKVQEAQQWALANRANIEKQVKDQQAEIAKRDKLISEIKAKADLSDSLQKKVDGMLAEKQKDEETGNAFIRWIGGLFNRG